MVTETGEVVKMDIDYRVFEMFLGLLFSLTVMVFHFKEIYKLDFYKPFLPVGLVPSSFLTVSLDSASR